MTNLHAFPDELYNPITPIHFSGFFSSPHTWYDLSSGQDIKDIRGHQDKCTWEHSLQKLDKSILIQSAITITSHPIKDHNQFSSNPQSPLVLIQSKITISFHPITDHYLFSSNQRSQSVLIQSPITISSNPITGQHQLYRLLAKCAQTFTHIILWVEF